MLRFLFLIVLLVAGLVVGLAFVPIETALKFSGAADHGVEWSSAKGTILSGSLKDLKVRGTEYGSADLQLDAPSLLNGKPRYDVDWTGTHGRGSGKVSLDKSSIYTLEDYTIDLDLLAFDVVAKWLQQSGGRIKLAGPSIRFQGNQCLSAEGVATSDVLDRNRQILGAGWSELRGDLSCQDGKLLIPLASENATGTRFLATLLAAPGAPGKFEARITGTIPRTLNFALPLAGFVKVGDDFVFSPGIKAKPSVAP
jgi:hypothetical protein